eukprot:CAMPEP_0182918832 /NCGR_PEP_ID=MMETSP0105_2-20130417/2324_1 /TAXON_ID=81532 ORGANISM="Acanthoeca-like sp., Strain 10tr" /NCGR_SAMPLE_ID=MMETSP0105_2 /ASSEMBLY_ACC=CAM_ASM_000205 /LENGTH=503 /DNA_ID=CAMNT_0025055951 /DNA_START=203 /DNA_END=1714 /DNA_ORIENTATION=+
MVAASAVGATAAHVAVPLATHTAQFHETASSAGVSNDGKSFAVSMADVDNDGHPDLFLTNSGSADKLYINTGKGEFTDGTSAAGISSDGASRGVAIGDVTGDGFVDIYIADASAANTLWINDGTGKFTDGTAAAGVGDTGMGQSVSLGDVDGDGDLDIFVCNFQSSNVLFRNNGKGTFTDDTTAAGLTSSSSGFEGTFGYYNNDSHLDIYVSNSGKDNVLYVNNGEGVFTDMSSTAGVKGNGDQGRGTAWGDMNNDGFLDLAMVSADPAANRLYHNNGDGTFSDVTSTAGVAGDYSGVAQGMNLADLNADGYLDFIVTGLGPLEETELYESRGTDHYNNVASNAGVNDVLFGQGVAAGDLDGDGDLDMYIDTWGYPPVGWPSQGNKLYINKLVNVSYLKVRPLSSSGHATLLGAVVRLFLAGTRSAVGPGIVLIDGGGGFCSQNAYDAYFGLQSVQGSQRYDVEIRLPGGQWITKTALPALGAVAPNMVLEVEVPALPKKRFT